MYRSHRNRCGPAIASLAATLHPCDGRSGQGRNLPADSPLTQRVGDDRQGIAAASFDHMPQMISSTCRGR
ncbi:MAG: hypothetical protein EA377_09290 [Phycisphaerales bacterium]|nr:MAG: hypothetical protein EA377_09290 [Phycisphaerales bacterium]